MRNLMNHPLRQVEVLLVSSVLVLLLFVALSNTALASDPILNLDGDISKAIHDAGETPITTFFEAFTHVGSEGAWLVGVGMGAWFLVRREWRTLAVWAVALIGGKVLNWGLKDYFARPRPTFALTASIEEYSYPSGHAMLSIITFGLAAFVLWRRLPSPLARRLILNLTGTVIILVGISRLVLNMHFLSDIIGGWIIGGLWVLLWAVVLIRVEAFAPEED